MKAFISSLLVATLTMSPALAQQSNYTSISQLTQAAQQASSGQLGMVHGGFIGGGMNGAMSADTSQMAQPIQPAAAVAAQPIGAPVRNDDSTLIIAATIGAAALLIPVAIGLLSSDDN